MSAACPDFASVLLARQALSPEQLGEAWQVQAHSRPPLEQVLVRLGYASPEDVARAWAELLGLPFLDLAGVTVPAAVLELVPESVARENFVLPVAVEGETLTVAVCDPTDG